jgi:hypothetical protein
MTVLRILGLICISISLNFTGTRSEKSQGISFVTFERYRENRYVIPCFINFQSILCRKTLLAVTPHTRSLRYLKSTSRQVKIGKTSLFSSQNRFSRSHPLPPATEQDLETFKSILRAVGAAKPEEVPSVIGAQVEFLLSRNLAELAKQAKRECVSPLEAADLDTEMETVLAFLEEFVIMAKKMAADNKDLLREILQAANMGMDALDSKIKDVVSGADQRYTPEFVRYLSSEISRLEQVIAADEQSKAGAVPSADEDEEQDEAPARPGWAEPDARTTMLVLSMIKVLLPAVTAFSRRSSSRRRLHRTCSSFASSPSPASPPTPSP